MTDDQAAAEPLPLTYNDVDLRYGVRVWEAIERRDELAQRDLLARTESELKARGEWDPDKFAGGRQPLAVAERLELIAPAEYISRSYQPHGVLDEALRAGATLEQVAAALGVRENAARERISSWAEGQHNLWNSYGDGEHRFGLSDDEHAAVLGRLEADPEAYQGGIGDHEAPGDLPDAALPAAADYIGDAAAQLEAADREAGQ